MGVIGGKGHLGQERVGNDNLTAVPNIMTQVGHRSIRPSGANTPPASVENMFMDTPCG